MTAKTICLTTAAFVAGAFAASANAQYRCDPAPSCMDRAACKAADKSPDALRQFVQRRDRNRVNLEFADYVNLKTAQRWQAEERRLAEAKVGHDSAPKVARNEVR
jgi:hypothetical protein